MVENHYKCEVCGAEAADSHENLHDKGWRQVEVDFGPVAEPGGWSDTDEHAAAGAACPKCVKKLRVMFDFGDW